MIESVVTRNSFRNLTFARSARMLRSNTITKPIHRLLTDLTREPRVEVALPLAMKDWVRLKLWEARQQRQEYETRYGMDFDAFKQAWQSGSIPDAHSYEVEREYWEWEAVVTDEDRLQQISESLP